MVILNRKNLPFHQKRLHFQKFQLGFTKYNNYHYEFIMMIVVLITAAAAANVVHWCSFAELELGMIGWTMWRDAN